MTAPVLCPDYTPFLGADKLSGVKCTPGGSRKLPFYLYGGPRNLSEKILASPSVLSVSPLCHFLCKFFGSDPPFPGLYSSAFSPCSASPALRKMSPPRPWFLRRAKAAESTRLPYFTDAGVPGEMKSSSSCRPGSPPWSVGGRAPDWFPMTWREFAATKTVRTPFCFNRRWGIRALYFGKPFACWERTL